VIKQEMSKNFVCRISSETTLERPRHRSMRDARIILNLILKKQNVKNVNWNESGEI
jgi:hypothetical protein